MSILTAILIFWTFIGFWFCLGAIAAPNKKQMIRLFLIAGPAYWLLVAILFVFVFCPIVVINKISGINIFREL